MKRCAGVLMTAISLMFFVMGQTVAAEGPVRQSVMQELKEQNAEPVRLAMRADAPAASSRSGKLKAVIDLTEQEMKIYVDGSHQYTWKVSTGRSGYITPNGTYKPQWLARMHYSRKYDDAPMPHSVFFHGGYAVHGTTSISRLGRPASHGCVRLHPDNAKAFFNLVQKHGKSKSTIEIVGTSPVKPVPKSTRNANGTLNHRPVYGESASTGSSRSSASNSGACLGCGSMANFGTVPSIH